MTTITSIQIINILTKNLEVKQSSYEAMLNKLLKSKDPSDTLKWSGDLINLAAAVSVYKNFLMIISEYISSGLLESQLILCFKKDLLKEITKGCDVMNRSTSIMNNLVVDAEKNIIKELFYEFGFSIL